MSCEFCDLISDGDELILAGAHVAAFLDHRPVFHGHVLVAPVDHVPTLAELPSEAMVPFLEAVQVVMAALGDELGAEGTFVAVNNVVSQSVPHLHCHVVPRRRKDGLRGFFWPRHPYADEDARVAMRDRLGAAVERAAAQRLR